MNWKPFIALPLLFSAACGVLNNLQSATPKHAEYNAPAHAATSAVVMLSASPEAITIKPLASGAENYFDAQIDYIGTIHYDANAANDDYSVTLTEDANNLNYSGAPLTWDIGIDPSIPLSLDAHSSSGFLTFDLGAFTLTSLRLDTSSGKIETILPVTDQQYDASLSTSSGSITATVMEGAQVNLPEMKSSSGNLILNTGVGSNISADLESSSGAVTVITSYDTSLRGSIAVSSGSVDLHFGETNDAEFTISSSSGAITAHVLQDAAVRLEVVQNSSGAVNVPDRMQRISGDDKTGVWETPGFDQAERKIIIVVTRTSSGAVTIQ